MKVVIDAFGGDNAPREIVKGALEYLKEKSTNNKYPRRYAEIKKRPL